MAREFEAGARLVFSAGPYASAQHHYRHITLLHLFYGFGYAFLFIAGKRIVDDFRFRPMRIHQVASFCIHHLRAFVHLISDALQYGCDFHGNRSVMCKSE